MTATAQSVIAAIQELVCQALPNFDVERNVEGPERYPATGLAIVRDGDAGEPDVTLSPLTYHYNHAVRVEIIVCAETRPQRDVALSLALQAVGVHIEANRSLGGLCDWLAPADEPPGAQEFHIEGGSALLLAELDIVATYSTTNPLL